MRVPMTPQMTLQQMVEELVQAYLNDPTITEAVSQVALEAGADGQPVDRKMLIEMRMTLKEVPEWPTEGLLPSTGVPGQPRMEDLERK